MDNSTNDYNPFGMLKNVKPNQIQSPYLNTFSLPSQISSEYISIDGPAKNRGRFELAFSQIGASVIVGSGLGGAIGTYKGFDLFNCPNYLSLNVFFIGFKEVSQLEAFLSVKRTKILNYMTRNGARMANTFGSIALTYSIIGVGLSFVQDNDDLNTLISAVSTGALYGVVSKPSTDPNIPSLFYKFEFFHLLKFLYISENILTKLRLKRVGIGSLFGTLAASAYVLLVNRDNYLKN